MTGRQATACHPVSSAKIFYNVSDELIQGIKEKVRQLCADPKEAYAENGAPEGFIRFGREKERIFTDPDKTLELLGWIASKSIPDRSGTLLFSELTGTAICSGIIKINSDHLLSFVSVT